MKSLTSNRHKAEALFRYYTKKALLYNAMPFL